MQKGRVSMVASNKWLKLLTLLGALLCVVGLAGCAPSAEDQAKADAIDGITTTSGGAIVACQHYLSGEISLDVATSVLKSYDEDVDKQEDALNECGLYSSCGLYIGQLKATLSSWDKLKLVENPENSLRSNMDSLQKEIDSLKAKRPTTVKG